MFHKKQASQSGITPSTLIIPEYLGQIYVDIQTNKIYIAKSLVQGDWVELGTGGGEILSKCRVYFDGTQNFAIGTPKKVIFNYINFDVNTEWDVTNNRFVVKESGYYLMIGQLQWANYKSKAGSMMFYRNYGLPGADALLIVMGSDTISGAYINGSTINYLNANDYVEVWGLASTAVSYGGSSTMFFAIHRLS